MKIFLPASKIKDATTFYFTDPVTMDHDIPFLNRENYAEYTFKAIFK